MKDVYWRKMFTFKYELCYLSFYFERCIFTRRVIKIINAVVSSAAIASWAAWTDYAAIWGTIIVLSQVFGAVFEIVPLQERISTLSNLIGQLSLLYVEIEREWNKVNNDDYSDADINDLIYDFEKRWTVIDNKSFTSDVISQSERFREKANKEAEEYFRLFS